MTFTWSTRDRMPPPSEGFPEYVEAQKTPKVVQNLDQSLMESATGGTASQQTSNKQGEAGSTTSGQLQTSVQTRGAQDVGVKDEDEDEGVIRESDGPPPNAPTGPRTLGRHPWPRSNFDGPRVPLHPGGANATPINNRRRWGGHSGHWVVEFRVDSLSEFALNSILSCLNRCLRPSW